MSPASTPSLLQDSAVHKETIPSSTAGHKGGTHWDSLDPAFDEHVEVLPQTQGYLLRYIHAPVDPDLVDSGPKLVGAHG